MTYAASSPSPFGPAPGENRFSHLDSAYRCAPQCSDIGPVVENHPEELDIQLVPQKSVQKASLIFSGSGSIGPGLQEERQWLSHFQCVFFSREESENRSITSLVLRVVVGASLYEQMEDLHLCFMVNIVPAFHQCVEKGLVIEGLTSPLAMVRHLSSQSFWAIQTKRQKKFEALDMPFRLVKRLEKPYKSLLKDPLNILL
ncbi:hypothetical protein Cob_v011335 [Colletotrichum orbiculare MAFF 240422]|uniref:Uncharacterized protein n=1 Tax=Colletotrichum orbiculare (strain 104-T / ATCC 96160 / CBS 514.97 / LARS 414 / MAFF 240422) TaxID=1213857 RepID=A0A484FC19_COLOR|nr:hypothetical protein Cob_v011335 [Colletotrichum orbiculare MAFF 240422]